MAGVLVELALKAGVLGVQAPVPCAPHLSRVPSALSPLLTRAVKQQEMEFGVLQTVVFEGNGRTGAGTSAREGKALSLCLHVFTRCPGAAPAPRV